MVVRDVLKVVLRVMQLVSKYPQVCGYSDTKMTLAIEGAVDLHSNNGELFRYVIRDTEIVGILKQKVECNQTKQGTSASNGRGEGVTEQLQETQEVESFCINVLYLLHLYVPTAKVCLN